MRIVLEKRNSPSFRNDLKLFEVFSAIVDSLRESTQIQIEVEEMEEIVLRNGKYYLAIPATMLRVLDYVLEGVVLRRTTLNNLELLTLYALFKEGVVKAGRVEEISSSEVRSRIIEVVS
jgi:hypothetical protein